MSTRVLLDVDGVIADFVGAYLRIANHKFGTNFTPDQVTDWEIGKGLGIIKEQERSIYDAIKNPGFARYDISPFPEAQAGVLTLQEISDVYFVTAPLLDDSRDDMTWMHDRQSWLAKYFSADKHHIIHASGKHVVAGDVMVDDKPANLRSWKYGTPLLWNRTYNQEEKEIQRVSSWREVAAVVRAHARH